MTGRYRMFVRLVAVAAAAALIGSACAQDDVPGIDDPFDAAAAVLRVAAAEDGEGGYSFELDESVPAGATRISVRNTGEEPHHAQLFRLNDDATMQDVEEVLAAGDPEALVEVGLFDGGTGAVSPGSTSEADAIAELAPGTYAFFCFLPDAEGVPHLFNGMRTSFEVTETDDLPALPDADGEATLINYGFQLPDAISAGDIINVRNSPDAELHEMNVVALDEGVSAEEFLAALGPDAPPGPPPGRNVGGMQALMPGQSQMLEIDVDPGTYAFVCFIPNDEGVPHFALGMVREVTIE